MNVLGKLFGGIVVARKPDGIMAYDDISDTVQRSVGDHQRRHGPLFKVPEGHIELVSLRSN